MRLCLSTIIYCAVIACPVWGTADTSPATRVIAADVIDDGGGALEVKWEASPSEGVIGYEIIRTRRGGEQGVTVGEVPPLDDSFVDTGEQGGALERGGEYRYFVRTLGADSSVDSAPSQWISPKASWMHSGRVVNMGAVLVFAAMFFVLVLRGRRGKPLYIRPIDALDAMDDAVGRAAEMGRPVFYAPGLHSITQPATVASVGLLSRVAERSARLHTPVKVPNYDPLTWPVAQEVVKQAFARAGRPDEFNPDDVSYLTSRSFTYAAAVAGIMVRERTASNFLIGHFYSESLILAETGVSTGALQIGGTDSVAQLPFFITTCDKTMIGEELFAAAALVENDPVSRSTIKAHDWFKLLIMVVVLGGVITCLLVDRGVMARLLDALGVGSPEEVASGLANILRGGW